MEDPVAILNAIEYSFGRGDRAAVRTHAGRLEALAQHSAEAAYVASKAFEHGACPEVFGIEDSHSKRRQYLIRAAQLDNPIAQIELAANYAYGTNGYDEDLSEFQKWIDRAAQQEPSEAAWCYADVAQAKRLSLPEWVATVLRS